ncbi:AAA-ATPase At3g50940-like [Curcuma longa]|uniref:AAA-ATPase At3g50940-like n=1 Tax=Curcuma longa TaxID=136217 RepID=UPI003D9EDA58
MATTKTFFSTAVSIAASAVLVRTIANDLIPDDLRDYLSTSFASLFGRLSSVITVVVDEFDGFASNKMFKAAEIYVGGLSQVASSTRRLRVGWPEEEDSDALRVTMERGEEVVDVHEGVRYTWRLVLLQQNATLSSRRRQGNFGYHRAEAPLRQERSFEVSCHKRHKEACLKSYLPHVLERSKAMRKEERTRKLYTNEYQNWREATLRHPGSFATLAMEEEMKRAVVEDLERFARRKEYYRKIGRAWKRGYLLYGPPGTGKSSLIAAMANFLHFDVYDLGLSEVTSNSELRTLMMSTTNRSILVVEDIDCSMEMQQNREDKTTTTPAAEEDREKVTLSGLLNFVDGLWSSAADERIIVFTTNYKDRLDPALLRPGRMDMHIHMGYCTPCGFRILASNYHSVDDHSLFPEIEALIQEVDVSPAEVAGELMRSEEADEAFQGLIKLLHIKRKEKTDNAIKE